MADILAASLHRGNPEESASSSDAEDIIIRSTRTQPANQSCGKQDVSLVSSGWCPKDKKRISVQKLRGAPSSSRFIEPSVQQADVPPALAANKLPTSPWVEGNRGSLHGNLALTFWHDHKISNELRKSLQFASCLMKLVRYYFLLYKFYYHFHTAPSAGVEAPRLVSGVLTRLCPQAQSDVEARVSQVSEGLQKLREAERPRNKSQGSEAGSPLARVSRLEEQLSALTQQRLQHLERIQAQQLELQVCSPSIHTSLRPSIHPSIHPSTHPAKLSASSIPKPSCGNRKPCFPRPGSRNAPPIQRRQNLPPKIPSSSTGNSRLLEEIASEPTSREGRTGSTGGVDVTMGMVSVALLSTLSLVSFSRLPSSLWRPVVSLQPREAPCVFQSSSGQHTLAPQPSLLQKSQLAPSMFEEAGRVLREIRHSKKVLEENLEAILRAKDAEMLYSQLEGLSGNSDATEELRIKQTVDAWISTLSRDIQNPTSIDITAKYKGANGPCQSAPRWAPRKPSVRNKLQGPADSAGMRNRQSAPHTMGKLAAVEKPQAAPKPEREDEEYLMKIYGKALYEGHRRTLKNSPYLRFNSPSPKSKGLRPRVVERVKGVKVKSAKTQTSPCSGQRVFSSQPQYIFSPMQEVSDDPKGPRTPMEGFLIPMAIPLGQPRIDGEPPQPSSVIIGSRPITVTAAIPPTSTTRRPNVAVLEMTSKRKAPPQLQVQVGSPQTTVGNAQISAMKCFCRIWLLTLVFTAIEEEEDVFPGTDFLAVADITQPEAVEDLPVRIDGLPVAPGAPYHGPVFPPQAPEPPHLENPTCSTIQQETLENRLVDWVEQQLMARMVTELHPWAEPASPSPESCSSASDIVEAAGGGGLQLFVDAGVPVNSDLIRQYVNESLAEMVALFLGQRPAAPGLVEDIPIPETPVPTPRDSPPPVGRTQIPLGTPEASELESLSESCREKVIQPVESFLTLEPERSPVATPKCTPVPSPPVLATPTPPSTHLSPSAGCQYSDAWGDSELPLEEEAPPMRSEQLEGGTGVMSVAREEEPVSLISSMPPLPVEAILLPPMQTPPLQRATPPPVPTLSTEDSSTASSVTETELVGRHISEGELLVSCGQVEAARGKAGGGILAVLCLSMVCVAQSLWDEESSLGEVSKGQRPPVAADVEHALRGLSLLGLAGPEMGRLSSPGQVPAPSGKC
uniref:Si:ch211-185a18.2 n=1 Tax=Paramormyrops kingsleyae TaxID=1676925 RepID=A0A3B3T469_9TELE